MTTFLVKTENAEKDTVYFEVYYNHDHHNNYIDLEINKHPLTEKYTQMGYSAPVVVASYDKPISKELSRIEEILPNAKKNRKGFPMQYYDLIEKKNKLSLAADIIASDSFVVA